MNSSLRCAAVIPCLNEARAIADVVAGARQYLSSIFVVDDGSRDDTSALAEEAGAEVLRHQVSQGKGAALKTGWQYAQQRGFNWALALDGDGQHSAEDIPKFLDAAGRTSAELVVGNRMENPRGMPGLRRIVNRWMSKRISTLAGLRLPDSQCGFRLMNLERWSKLPVIATCFEIESDVLLAFAKHGCSIEFVPIRIIYRTERSKIRPMQDTARWFRWWWRARRQMSEGGAFTPLTKPILNVSREVTEQG